MLLSLSPLLKYRDFRLIFFGQFVSLIGTMISYVCLPFQCFKLTNSPFWVGALGAVEFIAVILFALWGGVVADRYNRKKVLLISESIMSVCLIILIINSLFPSPSVTVLFIVVFVLMAVTGYHRPAMDAMIQKIVKEEDYAAMGALRSASITFAAILGPAFAGIILGHLGIVTAYLFDLMTFVFSIVAIIRLSQSYSVLHKDNDGNALDNPKIIFRDIFFGLKYARKKQVLLGTYFVDIIAMVFAYPVVLFPMLIQVWGISEKQLGWPYSMMFAGAFFSSLLSGKVNKVVYKGRMVVFSALFWGLSMIGFGLTNSFLWALFFLFMAGIGDGFSGLFRGIIWNEEIPNNIRGRLSSIEMISYTTGPLLGNFRAGEMAGWFGISMSSFIGGTICFFGIIACTCFLPVFWNYRRRHTSYKNQN
ncbi:MAG: MFS transporter [Oligoflexia bacterium]|nr:MFS transporter [Oligoflexia bacterium]